MIRINLKEAEGHLGELIEEVAAGEEVVITSDGGPAVCLVLVLQEGQERQDTRRPTGTVGTALDHFIGTWSAEQEAEVLKAVEIFEQVDEAFWH